MKKWELYYFAGWKVKRRTMVWLFFKTLQLLYDPELTPYECAQVK